MVASGDQYSAPEASLSFCRRFTFLLARSESKIYGNDTCRLNGSIYLAASFVELANTAITKRIQFTAQLVTAEPRCDSAEKDSNFPPDVMDESPLEMRKPCHLVILPSQ